MNEKRNIGRVTLAVKVRRALWAVARVLLFRPFPTKLFRPWRLVVLRCFGAKVHPTADVYASARIWAPWLLEVGRGACVGPDVVCYNQARVVLEEDACVSQEACLCTAGHDVGEVNNAQTSLTVADIVLRSGAWVGMRAFVGAGVVVGERAVVGAAAAVFRDVEPWTVVGGNPARLIKEIAHGEPS